MISHPHMISYLTFQMVRDIGSYRVKVALKNLNKKVF